MKFLISNDDGVHAPGLLALYEELSKLGDVVVVAPDTEQSGTASSLHLSQPLYTQELASGFIAVNGSPADCIYLALHQLYPDTQFDCVITGINSGANLGQDVLYSGTFGAALTAQIFGIPSIATSLVGGSNKGSGQDQVSQYQIAAQQIVKLVTETSILAEIKALPYHVLNINIPNVEKSADIKGYKITRLGHSLLAHPVHQIVDPRGREAYWLSLQKCRHPQTDAYLDASNDTFDHGFNNHSNDTLNNAVTDNLASDRAIEEDYEKKAIIYTDDQAIAAGYISLSPVRLHHTPTSALDKLAALKL